MIDAYTVLRKELLEAFGDRYAFRGPMLQAALVILITGLVVPALDSTVWQPSAVVMLYVVFPSTLAAIFAAEAFAGEKERRTLETLLSTPLSDSALFLGKTSTAVLFVIVVSAASLLVGMTVAAIRGLLPTPVTPLLFLGVLGGALGGGLLTAAIAMVVSVHLPVARSAQQMSSMMTLLLAGVGAGLLKAFGSDLSWPMLLRAEAVVLLLAGLTMVVGIRMFRRELFFERR